MLKLTKTIVDKNRKLIGFMLRGKDKEFGGFSTTEIERGIPITSLVKDKFCNNQIAVVNSKLVEKNNFKINSLPMVVYNGQDYIETDNHIKLIGRFVQDNENIGFRVKFSDGSEDNLRYLDILNICKWFKPDNFLVRTSVKGKQYICGKKGILNLDDLPATIIGEQPEVKAKRTKSAAKETTPEFNGAMEIGYDILDIYEFIASCNGCVIKLPGEEYISASDDGETKVDNFIELGIGEVATPYPMFNETKLNVNAGFKKVGMVPVEINGVMQNITTFIYRTKSLFLNGENYMKKFGIAVPTDKEAELVKLLGRTLALEKIEDTSITSPLGQVIDAKSLSFYKVNSDKIDLISNKKRVDSILKAKQLVEICKEQYVLKLVSKAVGPRGGLMKQIKEELGVHELANEKGDKPFGIFSMMNDDALRAISEAGIDIYTGAYTVPGTTYVKESKGGSGEGNKQVEIEYILKGYDASKITGAKVLDAVKKGDTSILGEDVTNKLQKILAINNLVERYKAAEKVYKEVNNKLDTISKRLWMHNASMYLTGSKAKIHTHDGKYWTPDTTSRVKIAQVYVCKLKGAENLTIKFNGVVI